MSLLIRRYIKITASCIAITLLYLVIWNSVTPPPSPTLTILDHNTADGLATTPSSSNTSILLVTAMFPLAKCKHSRNDYHQWMDYFLGQVKTDIYMFTTPEIADIVRTIRGDLPIVFDTTYSSPFDVPPLQGLEETYTIMGDMDRQKSLHSPGLYAVWNAKPYLLDTAVKKLARTGKRYTYAFWNDGGSFREKNFYGDWPNAARIDQVWKEGSRLTGSARKELLFFPVLQHPSRTWATWRDNMGPIDNTIQISEGSFFGGSPETVHWFSNVFYAYHHYYLALGHFVGIDQDIFNSLLLLFPERIFTVWYYDPSAPVYNDIITSKKYHHSLQANFLGECGDIWFYYQFWLAGRRARDKMRETWVTEERDWRIWRKPRERKLCRLIKPMSMIHFLRMSFGESWAPPLQTIPIPRLQ